MGTRVSKGNNKPGKKLYKAKATLGSQMEIRHEDKTVQLSLSMITVSISDFCQNLYFGRRFIRLAMRLEKKFIVTLKKT